jgi:hypothetical protein
VRRDRGLHDAAGPVLQLARDVCQRGVHLRAEASGKLVRRGAGLQCERAVPGGVLDRGGVLRGGGDEPERGVPGVQPESVDDGVELQVLEHGVPGLCGSV